jgi:hypothetical protein
MTAKQLLLHQTALAFSGRPDMSLMAALKDITQAEGDYRPSPTTPTTEQLVRHVAWTKSHDCHEAFGQPMVIDDPSIDYNSGDHPELPWEFPCGAAWGITQSPGIAGAVALLTEAHRTLTDCLESCPDEMLDQPLPTRHGKSAAHFFTIMLIHDLYHAGQIRSRRTACQPTPPLDPRP